MRWRQSSALGKLSQNEHRRAVSSSQASSSDSLQRCKSGSWLISRKLWEPTTRAVTAVGRQYSCHGSLSSGAGLGGLGCCGEEEEEEEERFTRWQSALRLPVGTWANGVVKGPGSSFAQESYSQGANSYVHPGSHGVAGLVCRELRQLIDRTGASAFVNTSQPVYRPCICGRKLKLMTKIFLQG